MKTMIKHYVTFMSPGMFLAEMTTQEIVEWDLREAVERAQSVKERHGAIPYGFYFTTKERGPDDFEPKLTKTSGTYYINGKVETLEEIEARRDPSDAILVSNMRCNHWPRVVRTQNGYGWAQPMGDDDHIVDADGNIVR